MERRRNSGVTANSCKEAAEGVCLIVCLTHIRCHLKYIYSLLATCKAQEVNPREWLNDVIARLPYYLKKDSGKNIWELFPDVWKLKKSNKNTIDYKLKSGKNKFFL